MNKNIYYRHDKEKDIIEICEEPYTCHFHFFVETLTGKVYITYLHYSKNEKLGGTKQ